VLTGLALTVTAVGFVLVAWKPAWLVVPLQDLVAASGAAGPVVFVLLCVFAAPFHLCGLLVALSVVVWPSPVAAALSFAGTLIGCLFTAIVLVRLRTGPARQRDGWPAWVERVAARVGRHLVLVGVTVRVVLQTGVAVEAFFLLTGYGWRHYLAATAVGLAVWVSQTLVGVAALSALVTISPWLVLLLVVVPLVAGAGVALIARRRTARP
jgi:hypothetical protein